MERIIISEKQINIKKKKQINISRANNNKKTIQSSRILTRTLLKNLELARYRERSCCPFILTPFPREICPVSHELCEKKEKNEKKKDLFKRRQKENRKRIGYEEG